MEKNEGNELKNFVETFFKNLGADVREQNGILIINKVAKDFEEICGKKAPFRFRFDNKGEGDSDFITKGSTILKSMMNYLEEKGKTTLIKLNFDRDFKEEISHYFNFKNAEINSLSKKYDFKTFVRFGIATTLQYLNEREQITNYVCVYDGKVIDFNLDKFKHEEGNKKEIGKLDYKEEYETAKIQLKDLVKRRVEETAKILSDKLDKEIERVKGHYVKQKHEIREQEIKINVQKQKLQEELKKASGEEWKHVQEKIKKLNDSLEEIKKADNYAKMQKEEDFFVNDEKQKHSLRISNKLINTAIIYYPIYNFEIYLKSKDVTKRIELIYEPFLDKILNGIACQSCSRDIREIFVCSSGHVACSSCTENCSVCNSTLCLSCSKKWCDICGRKLCKNCIVKCNGCLKSVCKLHSNKDYTDDKDYCNNCLVKCESCLNFTRKKNIRKIGERDICEKCFRISSLKRI